MWSLLISKWVWSKSKREPLLLLVRFMCKHLSKHMETLCFKWMQLIICKWYFNKVDLRRQNNEKNQNPALEGWKTAGTEDSIDSSWWQECLFHLVCIPLDWAVFTAFNHVCVSHAVHLPAGWAFNKVCWIFVITQRGGGYSSVHWSSVGVVLLAAGHSALCRDRWGCRLWGWGALEGRCCRASRGWRSGMLLHILNAQERPHHKMPAVPVSRNSAVSHCERFKVVTPWD